MFPRKAFAFFSNIRLINQTQKIQKFTFNMHATTSPGVKHLVNCHNDYNEIVSFSNKIKSGEMKRELVEHIAFIIRKLKTKYNMYFLNKVVEYTTKDEKLEILVNLKQFFSNIDDFTDEKVFFLIQIMTSCTHMEIIEHVIPYVNNRFSDVYKSKSWKKSFFIFVCK